jgi:hypothetical protein
MTDENAPAAGQGGTVTVLAPQTRDEVHRQNAVEELAGYLTQSREMLARCNTLSKATRGDRIGPLNAAARLMTANAQVAKALAHVALLESRHRTIVETVQPPKPENPELNSQIPNPLSAAKTMAEMEYRLEQLTEEEERRRDQLAEERERALPKDEAAGC